MRLITTVLEIRQSITRNIASIPWLQRTHFYHSSSLTKINSAQKWTKLNKATLLSLQQSVTKYKNGQLWPNINPTSMRRKSNSQPERKNTISSFQQSHCMIPIYKKMNKFEQKYNPNLSWTLLSLQQSTAWYILNKKKKKMNNFEQTEI